MSAKETTAVEASPDILRDRRAIVLILGIAAILTGCVGLILGPMAWMMGSRDLRLMGRNEMDPAGKTATTVGVVLGMIAIIRSDFWIGLTIIFLLVGVSATKVAPFIYTPF